MRHLLSIEDLDRAGIERILDRAKSFTEVSEREIKKVPALRGRRVLNLFYEASTRTRSSLRAGRQVASRRRDQLRRPPARASRRASRSRTPSRRSRAYRPDLIVIRTPHVGAAALVAGWTTAGVVNAGDGKHEHPTQALLDVYTLRERLGSLDGLNIWIVGDVLHSRVARSNIHAFTKMGAQGHRLRPADADPARDRGAVRRRLQRSTTSAGRRRLRAADAERAHERLLRAEPARVRRASTRSTAAASAPARC